MAKLSEGQFRDTNNDPLQTNEDVADLFALVKKLNAAKRSFRCEGTNETVRVLRYEKS